MRCFYIIFALVGVLGMASHVVASSTSNFTQTIGAGTLSVDIVNGSYVTVASPAVAMNSATFSFSCQTVTSTFGTASEQIYVSNPDAADNGWTATLAASTSTAVWDSAGTDFDFNDPGGSGCTDGGDTDSLGGQMTVNPSGATLAQGSSGNGTSGVLLGSSGQFGESTTSTITIVSSNGTTDIGDWTVRNVSISQKIPAQQPAASDYDINLVLSITAT